MDKDNFFNARFPGGSAGVCLPSSLLPNVAATTPFSHFSISYPHRLSLPNTPFPCEQHTLVRDYRNTPLPNNSHRNQVPLSTSAAHNAIRKILSQDKGKACLLEKRERRTGTYQHGQSKSEIKNKVPSLICKWAPK